MCSYLDIYLYIHVGSNERMVNLWEMPEGQNHMWLTTCPVGSVDESHTSVLFNNAVKGIGKNITLKNWVLSTAVTDGLPTFYFIF